MHVAFEASGVRDLETTQTLFLLNTQLFVCQSRFAAATPRESSGLLPAHQTPLRPAPKTLLSQQEKKEREKSRRRLRLRTVTVSSRPFFCRNDFSSSPSPSSRCFLPERQHLLTQGCRLATCLCPSLCKTSQKYCGPGPERLLGFHCGGLTATDAQSSSQSVSQSEHQGGPRESLVRSAPTGRSSRLA